VSGGLAFRGTQNRDRSKGAELPQIRRPTLQSQFSQGESMNELILKASLSTRVAETLRGTCKAVYKMFEERRSLAEPRQVMK